MSAIASKTIIARAGKRIFRWLLTGLILAGVLWLAFLLIGRALCHIAIGQIAELTNTKIETASVDFHTDGSVLIKKLVINPYKKQSAEDTILEAETVYARFGLGSLLLLRPRLKQIDVNDFVFNSQYDLDTGRWNLSALKIKVPKGGSGKMPLVRLEGGTLQYSKISDGQVKLAASVPLSARFGFDEEIQDGYSFDITTATMSSGFGKSHLRGFWKPGSVTIAGGISSADVPELEMVWTIDVLAAEFKYDRSDSYSLALRIKDLRSRRSPALEKFALVGPAFLEKSGPFNALQKFFNRYRPHGRVDIDLDASGNLNRLRESTLAGKVYCKDVWICDRKFQYPVEHLIGQLDFTEKSVLLNNLSGEHGAVKLFFNGWSRDFGADWKYEIRMTSENMVLDNELYNALSTKQKEFWSAFSPSGVAAIDYRLSRQSPTDKKKALAVELRGVEAIYRHFPYPLNNLTGKILFDRDRITFLDVISQLNERKITVNGEVTAYGSDRPKYDVSIDVNNIPLDSTLEAALPERQRYLYHQFDIVGLADGRIKVSTSEQNLDAASFIADLSFKKTSLKSEQFPQVISDISARAVFTPDLVRIENFNGRHGRQLVSLTGRIWPAEKAKQSRYSLSLSARQAPLNDDLFVLLPKSLKKIVSELQPKGKVNFSADLNKAGGKDSPDYRIGVDCLGNSVNFKWFAYPLKDITGILTITKDKIKLVDITAAPSDRVWIKADTSTIRLNGEISLADNAFSNGRFGLSAKDIFFEEQLGAALPESIASFFRKLSPIGRFDLDLEDIKITRAEDGEKYIDFDGIVRFKNCGFKISGARTEWDAALKTKGLYKTGDGLHKAQAFLSADNLRIQGKSFTDLKADIYYDRELRNWATRNLVADCYGGKLTGRYEFKQPADAPLEYLLQVGFDNVDLKQFLSDTRLEAASGTERTTGKMDGSLSVSGRIDDSSSRIGVCRLVITDMRVGELPPLAKLLQVLKLTEPKDFAFDQMLVDSYIRHNGLFFRKLDLSGESLAFYGSGRMDLQSRDIDLTLTARGQRLATADPSILQSLTEGLGQAVVRMEVTGDVYDPHVTTKTFPVFKDSLEILGTPR